MTDIERGVLDTSVLIAGESDRQLAVERLPQTSAISVVTLAELRVGVLAAGDVDTRARRLNTLQRVGVLQVLGIGAVTAIRWAELRAHLADRGRRANVNDLWIAATALANGIPVITQDDDFDALHGVAGLEVVRV